MYIKFQKSIANVYNMMYSKIRKRLRSKFKGNKRGILPGRKHLWKERSIALWYP